MIPRWFVIAFFSSLLIVSTFANNKHQFSSSISNSSTELSAAVIENGNYIVIGAFKDEKNAKRYVLYALKKGFNGRYFFNEGRDLFYVYVHRFKRRRRAFKITRKIQRYGLFDDVWVFTVGSKHDVENSIAIDDETIDSKKNIENIFDDTNADEKLSQRTTKEVVISVPEPKTKPNEKQQKRKKQKSRRKKRKEKKQKPNKPIGGDNMSIETENIASTEELKKAEIGDFVVFDNLLFHKSSAILKSKARKDLASLSDFLKTNPSVKIAIHGHTNGKFKGDIFLLKKGSDKYYTLNRKNVIIKGNEKRLSEERALLLKRYLVDTGIDATRIKVKGWGAKKMLYPKEHFKSAQNRRVEIEILKK